jgi:CRP-like cAMP-binding protein
MRDLHVTRGEGSPRNRVERRSAPSAADNALLAALAAQEDCASVAKELEPIYLGPGHCLCEAGSALTHVFFPAHGMIALCSVAANGDATALALVGREGMLGVEAFLGRAKASHRAHVLFPCLVYRLPLRTLRNGALPIAALREHAQRYALHLMAQISQTAVCNLRHPLEQRLCRVLLQSLDCVSGSALPITHDNAAGLVAARRQAVSQAARRLNELGLIRSARGTTTVLDRAGLMARACECYGILQADYGTMVPL